MSKLQKILITEITETNVYNLTLGHVFARKMARQAVKLLKAEDGPAYKQYKVMKFNTILEEEGVKGTATPESKQAAYIFAVGAAAPLIAQLYDAVLFDKLDEIAAAKKAAFSENQFKAPSSPYDVEDDEDDEDDDE